MSHDSKPGIWTPVPPEPETRWVDWDDGHAGGYPHPCTEYVGRHRLRHSWIWNFPDHTFKVNLRGGAFHG